MKKFLTLVGAFSYALSALSAAVSWNSGLFTDGFTDHGGNKITSDMGYTMSVCFYADSLGQTLLTQDSATVNGFGALTKTTNGDDTASPKYFENNTTYYIKAVVANSEYSRSTEILRFVVPETGNAILNITVGDGFTTEGNKWGEWKSVPEPTSGLLMLLGLTALVLKRKRV